MRKGLLCSSLLLVSSAGFAADLVYPTNGGNYIIPESSQADPTQAGKKFYTDLIVFQPFDGSHPSPRGETPASIACVYHLAKFSQAGCPTTGSVPIPGTGWPNTGAKTIAIVGPGSDPNTEDDLGVFTAQFGLPACTVANGCLTITWVGKGSVSEPGLGDQDERSLDTQWSHAMAPNAHIVVVEAASSSNSDMMAAEDLAGQIVSGAGGGEVSNSWSNAEYNSETADDAHFKVPGVVYLASSGDYSAPARYPSSSPYVISAGGTSILRDSNGNIQGETAWNINPNTPIGQKSGGSGGPSIYESRPFFQNYVANVVGTQRGTPDISFDADPQSGVDVYSSAHLPHAGWFIDGGTSVSSPSLAGLINSANYLANHYPASTQEELTNIYQGALISYSSYWRDILVGYNGFYCLPGYDFATGLGSPLTYQGK